MCEVGGKLTITYEDRRGYLKGRIGSKGFYVPAKGGSRMRLIAKQHEGQVVTGSTVRGMLVRIDGAGQARRDGWWWK